MDKITPLNLIKQVSPESSRRQTGFYKQIILEVLTVISAVGLGYFYSGLLAGKFGLAAVMGALATFTVLSTLHSFFARDFMRRSMVVVLSVLGVIFFFWGPNLEILLAAAAVMLVFLSWGGIAMRSELENSLEIRFFKATKPFLKKLTTGIIITFILLYIPLWSPNNIFVSRDNFKGFFDWASGVVSGFYPELKFNSTFSDLVSGVANLQLKNNAAFQELTAKDKETMLQQTTQGVSAGLSKSLGITINPQGPVSDAFYDFIIKFLTDWQVRYGNFFVVGWGIVIFLTIRGLGTLFYWLAGFLAFIFYQILLASGIIHIQGETMTHESIAW